MSEKIQVRDEDGMLIAYAPTLEECVEQLVVFINDYKKREKKTHERMRLMDDICVYMDEVGERVNRIRSILEEVSGGES